MSGSSRQPSPGRGRSRLAAFWGGFTAFVLAGIGLLQYLGPPPKPPPSASAHAAAASSAASLPSGVKKPPSPPLKATPAARMGTSGALAAGAPIPPAMPALLTPSATNPGWLVPRIGPDGLPPMRAYAAGASGAGRGPSVAVLVAGLGDDALQSQQAVASLPPAISLALTPYGQHAAAITALAHAAGHETLLAIPMQETDPASENAGNEALVPAGPVTLNQAMLDWCLSRVQGYAGVTDAMGATQGAGFMANPDAKAWLLQEIADKGLFFVDAEPTGQAAYAWNRTADVVIDPLNAPEKENAQLAELALDAKLQGAALGILLTPAPQPVQALAAWTRTLPAQGITLVPVSAIVAPPAGAPAGAPAMPPPASAGPSSGQTSLPAHP